MLSTASRGRRDSRTGRRGVRRPTRDYAGELPAAAESIFPVARNLRPAHRAGDPARNERRLGPNPPGRAGAGRREHGEGQAAVARVRPRRCRGPPVSRLVGYLTICLSQGENVSRLRNAQLTVVLIGAVAVLVSLPAMYWVVHRIFFPIRQLVDATDRIAAGRPGRAGGDPPAGRDRHARAVVQRDGTRVKDQRGELAEANEKLEPTISSRRRTGGSPMPTASWRRRSDGGRPSWRRRTSGSAAEIAEKEDFLRAVSHDLNAPLRNIAGMATMLLMKHRETVRRGRDPSAGADPEERPGRDGPDRRTAGAVAASRPAGRRWSWSTSTRWSASWAEVFEHDLETQADRAGRSTRPLPTLDCEQARLRQVFQNLIDNAIKYMGEGRGREGSEFRGQRSESGCGFGCGCGPQHSARST